MKKIFLMVLILPLLALAEDPFPTGRVAAEGQSPTDATQTSRALTESRSTASGTTKDPTCPRCVANMNLYDVKNTTTGLSTKPSSKKPAKVKK